MPDQPVRLVVGLGNPGAEYEHTRHNTGFWLLDQIAANYFARLSIQQKFRGGHDQALVDGRKVSLLKPTTFMNRSGESVAACAGFYKIPPEQILVLHDELDLPAGSLRLKFGGGHGGHNGLRDMVSHLGSRDFHRLRIGIGHPGSASRVVGYVLSRPSLHDRKAIDDAFIDCLPVMPDILAGKFQLAMNVLHTRS
jgi:PTH1 family peptidyl-tRNA hydrolase